MIGVTEILNTPPVFDLIIMGSVFLGFFLYHCFSGSTDHAVKAKDDV